MHFTPAASMSRNVYLVMFAQIAAKAGLRHVIRLEEARVDMRVIPLAHHELHHGQIELV